MRVVVPRPKAEEHGLPSILPWLGPWWTWRPQVQFGTLRVSARVVAVQAGQTNVTNKFAFVFCQVRTCTGASAPEWAAPGPRASSMADDVVREGSSAHFIP